MAARWRAGTDRLVTRAKASPRSYVVADVPNKGRTLFTNGHPMSSTARL